jgi:hypothetical protein
MPQCQFPIFCFFCISEKLLRNYSQNWTKQKPNIQKFTRASREPKRRQNGARRRPHHQGARLRAWPRLPMVRAPWSTFDAAPSPIKTPRREKPKHPITFPETHRDPPPSSTRDWEGPEALPGTLPERGMPPEVFFIAMLASGAMSEYSTLDYGSIVVASWLSSPPCASCLDLVSCFT